MFEGDNLHRLGRYVVVGIIFLILLLPLSGYFGKSRTVTGTLTFFYNVQIENQPVYLVVDLEDGQTIRASAPDKFDFRKGHKVLLNERTTVLGGKNYQFITYVN